MRPHVSIAAVDDRLAAGHRADVAGDRDRLAAGGLDLGDDLVGDVRRRLGAVDADAVVGDDDLGALGGRQQRDRTADAAPRTGDRDDLVLQISGHATPRPCVLATALENRVAAKFLTQRQIPT